MLVILTVVLLVSGLLAYFGGPLAAAGLMTHKVSFYLWLIAVIMHAGPHYLESVRLAAADTVSRAARRLPGARARRWAVLVATLSGVALALVLVWHVTGYVTP